MLDDTQLRNYIALFLLSFATSSLAGNVTVPNTFIDGTTASASQVNSNFGSLENAINDNDARITSNTLNINSNTSITSTNANAISSLSTQVTALNSSVGFYINNVRIGDYLGTSTSSLDVLLDSGYLALFSNLGGTINNDVITGTLMYESSDCSGQAFAYFLGSGTSPFSYQVSTGIVFSAEGINSLYYTPTNSTITPSKQLNSYIAPNNVCTVTNYNGPAYPVFPNDSNITGVDIATLTGNKRLGR